ncbi:MAG: hypothetical protein RB296_03315 [Acidobacteriota bacterium]|jgi:uncharacterized protein YacL|nr:hypothetical protein [Acidobacteriota bacterium]
MKKMNFLYSGIVLVVAGYLVRVLASPPRELTNLDIACNIVFVIGVLMILIGVVLEEKKKRRLRRKQD